MAKTALELTVNESTCSCCGVTAPNAVLSASRMWGHGTARPKKIDSLPEWNVSQTVPEGWSELPLGDAVEPVCSSCKSMPKASVVRQVAEKVAVREEAKAAAEAKAEAEAKAAAEAEADE